jgi:Ser/Thr protein kinase RdoA (MazF antagonist)
LTASPRQALAFFLPGIETRDPQLLGSGNVNDTWLVVTMAGGKYVLQRLNPHVFTEPGLVQDNLAIVSRHLQVQLQQIETTFIPLRVLRNPSGAASFIASDGTWWRLLSYIDDSQALNTVSTAEQSRAIGQGLGLFHRLTSSLDPSSLTDPLPDFHCTPRYLELYDLLLPAADSCAADCRDFINDRRQDLSLLEDARRQGTVRQQVIHGDPKVANFLFSRNGSQVISLIDLDTVKPGLLLHDIGDCLRSCCNPRGEEGQPAGDVVFEQELFAAMLAGYFSQSFALLTSRDKQLIVDSVRLISFELGLRFYSDHLAGNRYFKVNRPAHNLFRARMQFALVRSIEEQYSDLLKICSAALEAADTG